MKKILFVVPLPPPIHGASLINNYLNKSKNLKKNFKTYFFNSSQTKNLSEIEIFKFIKLFKFLFSILILTKKIIQIKPDIIYFNPSPRGIGMYRDLIYIFLFKIFSSKIVFHLHGKGFDRNVKSSKILKYILKFLFKNVDLICLSKLLIHDTNLIRDKKKKIYVLNNFAEQNKSKKKKKNKITFIYLSNLIPSKGILTFLNAIKYLNNSNYKNFNSIVIGRKVDEVFYENVTKIINNFKNISYLGSIYGNKKNDEIKKSHVLVFPSKYLNETYPVVLLEAMSAGVPVISYKNGAIPEIIEHNKTGFLVKKYNFVEFAKYMKVYLKNKQLIKNHGLNAKNKWQKNYTFQIYESKLINILNNISTKYKA